MTAEHIYEVFKIHRTISTDTRQIEPDSIFFALKGDKFDANQFAKDALEKGAAFAVIDDAKYQVDGRFILVDNVLETLQALAKIHREQLDIPFVAICGSNGKTTTKELLHAVLSEKYKTFATKGNLNNHIGVPLTILSIPVHTQMVVIEIGANHIQETADLCEIAMPNYGIVTNNGKDHLEGFGSIEGVRKANGELYEWLYKTNGTAFVNASFPDLMEDSKNVYRKTYGALAKVDYKVLPFHEGVFAGAALNGGKKIIKSQLAGDFNFDNIASAIAIGLFFDVPSLKIKQAIESYKPSLNRSQILEKEGTTYWIDCYNANPSSMRVALESFAKLDSQPKAVVLADMLELGEFSDTEHEEMIHLLKNLTFDKVILVGSIFGKFASQIESIHFEKTKEAAQWFQAQDWSNYSILLKGSRGYKLEQLLAEK